MRPATSVTCRLHRRGRARSGPPSSRTRGRQGGNKCHNPDFLIIIVIIIIIISSSKSRSRPGQPGSRAGSKATGEAGGRFPPITTITFIMITVTITIIIISSTITIIIVIIVIVIIINNDDDYY